jgi:putative nucleotidyltransferase with HDIG domain
VKADPFGGTEAFTEAHGELASAALAGVPPGQRTLLVQLLARSFVSVYASSLAAMQPKPMIDWIDRMCDAHLEAPEVATFFASAPRSLEAFLAHQGVADRHREPLRALEPVTRSLLDKPRRPPPAADERLGEVDAAINSMVMRLERVDPLTAEHSRAVAAWCARLARRLTLSETEVTYVARCGMLHDVGKITTPPAILCAPRNLTTAEWLIMREHPPTGEQIILGEGLAGEFTKAVRSHHERLDGRGYPDGMDRFDIPLVTRIVTVADCFNAMIGRRPYRPAMSPALALEQLESNRGTQFDSDIVDAMLDVVRKR